MVLLLIAGCTFVLNARVAGAQEESRKVKVRVQPTYPELARTMHITGTVRMLVVVTPAGTVESVKPMGGHPLLVDAARHAVKRWKFEAAPKETTTVMEFKFMGGM
jgi:TonB family protein